MFEKPSLIMRIGIGKMIGLIFGLIAFLVIPLYAPEIDLMFRLGVWLWLIITGAFVGLMGVMTYHPVLHLPLPWWFRGPLIGFFMMLNLWMVAPEKLEAITVGFFGPDTLFSHGLWVTLDGLVIGLLMSFFATRFGGEGKDAAGH